MGYGNWCIFLCVFFWFFGCVFLLLFVNIVYGCCYECDCWRIFFSFWIGCWGVFWVWSYWWVVVSDWILGKWELWCVGLGVLFMLKCFGCVNRVNFCYWWCLLFLFLVLWEFGGERVLVVCLSFIEFGVNI